MKILFLTPKWEGLVCIDILSKLEKKIGELVESKWAGKGHEDFKDESIDDTIKRLYGDGYPDWVITFPYTSLEGYRWVDFVASKKRDYKLVAWVGDLHWNPILQCGAEGYVKRLNDADFDVIWMAYKYTAYSGRPPKPIYQNYYLDNLEAKVFHVPCFACKEDYSDYPKTYDAVSLCQISPNIHPIRYAIHQELPNLALRKKFYGRKKRVWKVVLRDRPVGRGGNRLISRMQDEGFIVGDMYREVLSRSKVFLFGSSIYRYPLFKYMEGFASKSLVMADMPLGGEELGLVSGFSREGNDFVLIDESNWKQKLQFYLENEDERRRIVDNAYETFIKYHSCKKRAEEIVEYLEMNK